MRFLSLMLIGLCLVSQAQACLWDTDTVAVEDARFPYVADIIAGNFPRHSREFHQWRKAKCEAAIAADSQQASLYDDLAVSQHKLGDHQGAITTMMAKEKVLPKQYETYSNLGTFYIYTGDLNSAAQWIDRALAINPNAHFGREKYQKWLIEWLKMGRQENLAKLLALAPTYQLTTGFANVIINRSQMREWAEDLRKPALAGLLGMMRFADHDNPILLEALGDVLCAGEIRDNASMLATQAYLYASRKSTGDTEKQRLWKKMESAGGTIDAFKPKTVMRDLDLAVAKGAKLAEKVRADEIAWIKAGQDAGAEFQKKYLFTKR